MSKSLTAILLVTCFAIGSGCINKPTARDVWANSLNRCAESDLPRSGRAKLLYLGPSNPYGPGSGWRVADDGSLEPRWPLESAASADAQKKLVEAGPESECGLSETETFSISPSLLIQTLTVPLNADARADIVRSKTSTVRATRWRQDNLNELAYEEWLRSEESGEFGKDMLAKPGLRRVMKRAILVRGFSAELKYSAIESGTINAKYKFNEAVEVGGGLSLKRTSDTTLTLSSALDFYIVGTLVRMKDDGTFGMLSQTDAAQPTSDELDLPSDQSVRLERD